MSQYSTNPTYREPVETTDNERQPLIHQRRTENKTLYDCCRICITASMCSLLLTLIIIGIVYGLLVSRCHYQEYHNRTVMSIPPSELSSLEITLLPNAQLHIIQSMDQENVTIDTTIHTATLKDIHEISTIVYQQSNYSWVYSIQRPNYFTIWLCSHSVTILRLPANLTHISKVLITQGYSMDIEINLPKTKVDLLSIESSYADVSLNALNTTRFISITKSGTLKGNIKFINPEEEEEEEEKLQSSAKKCKMYIESKDGKTMLHQLILPERNNSCEIMVRSTTGEINLEMDNFSGNFEVNTQSGKIAINGNVEYDVDKETTKVGRLNGNGGNKLHAETVKGDVMIIAN